MNTLTTSDELDRDFLAALSLRVGPAKMEAVFDGLRPQWAVAAVGRCVRRGFVRTNPDGRLELLPAGRELLSAEVEDARNQA